MAKKKKKVPGLNTSSTADISFMLLIFFLVTTQMTQDKGLARRLPEPPKEEDNQVKTVNERNIFILLVNDYGQVMAKTKKKSVIYEPDDKKRFDEIRERVKEFVRNEKYDPELPDRVYLDEPIEGLPSSEKSSEKYRNYRYPTKDHVISVQCSEGAPYRVYFELQNCVVTAYNELREELAQDAFNKSYANLNETQLKGVRTYYAQRISEAEPRVRTKK